MNFSKKNPEWWKKIFIAAVFLIFPCGVGCASSDGAKMTSDVEALKTQIWNLQKQTAELGLKVSYASEEVTQLSERVSNVEDGLQLEKPAFKPKETSSSATKKPKLTAATEPPREPIAVAQAMERAPGVPLETWFKDLTPEEMYRQSLVYFNKADYSTAISGFSYLIRRFSDSTLAPTSQFWIGEAFYTQKRFARAVEEYRKVLTRYPGNPKSADAMLKIALCKMSMDLNSEGIETLRDVVAKYPDSPAAVTAKKLLNEPDGAAVDDKAQAIENKK
jgi:tol-pal system protein YbgF